MELASLLDSVPLPKYKAAATERERDAIIYEARLLFKKIIEIETKETEYDLKDDTNVRKLFLATIYADNEENWWWLNSEVCNLAQEWLFIQGSKYQRTKETEEKKSGFIGYYFSKVVKNHIKPYFLNVESREDKVNDRFVRQLSKDDVIFENQGWKNENFGCISSFFWLLKNIKKKELEENMMLCLPVIMKLIDDFEIKNKIIGTRMMKLVCEKADVDTLIKMGVLELFYKNAEKHLVLRKDDFGDELLDANLELCAIIIKMMHECGSQEYNTKLWNLTYIGILQNFVYSGDRIATLKVVVRYIGIISEMLGVQIVRYLKQLLGEIVTILNLEILGIELVAELQLLALVSLESLIKNGKPRVGYYAKTIVESLITCWDSAHNFTNDNMEVVSELKTKLKRLLMMMVDGYEEKAVDTIHEAKTRFPESLSQLNI